MRRRKVFFWAALLAAVAGLLVPAVAWRLRRAAPPDDAWASPFRNVRPDVRYTGDAACAQCHPDHAATYHQHPMSRSFAALSRPGGPERYDPASQNPFEKS